MADDLNTVIKKLMDNTSGQGNSDYDNICIANHIDYTKWNNHQRHDSNKHVFRVMGQFLGYPNLIERTHEFFQNSLIYYNRRPDLMKVYGEIFKLLNIEMNNSYSIIHNLKNDIIKLKSSIIYSTSELIFYEFNHKQNISYNKLFHNIKYKNIRKLDMYWPNGK